jgi:GNAT superfamily N-acetyltransferase
MSEFLIRSATLEDAEKIAYIHVKAWQESYKGIIDQNYLDMISFSERLAFRKKILMHPKSAQINLVAVQNNQIIGFCDAGVAFDSSEAYRGEIYAIYLLNEFKRHGVGKALFKHINKNLGEYLLTPYVTWVLEENKTACRFYEKCGGQFFKKKSVEIGDQNYIEIAYLFHRQEDRDEKYS